MTDFSSLPAKTQAHLARVSQAVAGASPRETKKWKVETKTLIEGGEQPPVIAEVKKWSENGCLYLYTFNIVSDIIDSSIIMEAYSAAKASKKGNRAYARLNRPSKCMYVGSSKKINQRLKEHLGFGAKGTYALQLAYWANQLPLEFELECAKYSPGIAAEVIQALEDTLWFEQHPMFGRQGAR